MDVKVIARYIVLILALINQWLTTKHINPLPVVSENDISSIITTLMGLYMAYKNNPNSKRRKMGKPKLKNIKQKRNIVMLQVKRLLNTKLLSQQVWMI